MRAKTLKIYDLSYKSLSSFFEGDVLYEADKIFIYFPRFTQKQVTEELIKQLSYLLKLQTEDIDGDSEELNDRGMVIDLLLGLRSDEESEFYDFASHITETLMREQMKIFGFRNLITYNGRKINKRYFNPNAEIIVKWQT